MLKFLLILIWCTSHTISSLIDYSLTRMLTINDTDSYFGYSIILQKGNPSIVIVGAPKKKIENVIKGSVLKCELNSLRCSEYSRISREKGINHQNRSGDFLGSVLDGDDIAGGRFFTCAPRFTIAYTREEYYTNGRCFQISNSLNVNEAARLLLPLSSERHVSIVRPAYYDAAFGEAGFNIGYIKEKNKLLTGAPGKTNWNGALVGISLTSYISRIFSVDRFQYADSYFGYAVAWGKFIASSQTIWYLIGGPRGIDLKGQVIFYDETGFKKKILSGEEYGSYFGASLLVIRKNQRGDDILIGAPMYSGSSWDEGCVYYYKNKKDGTFDPPIKLSNGKAASRFGTVMATTGDMDLDGFSDCAIAAPYEDAGVGAVYIFFGALTGFSNDKFLRISPSNFATVYPKTIIKGFGLGISNGNDINNDKHNDLAIGAYQSGQVFYFTTKQIFDVSMNMTAGMKILLTSTTNFSVTYCITFKYRNGDRNKKLSFFTRVVLDDDRILNRQNITNITTAQPHDVYCMTEVVLLKKDHLNIEPLTIHYGYRLNESQDQLIEKILSVPISYECGADNICQTNLTIKSVAPNISHVIFGFNDEAKINVEISNYGESAYQTKLYVKTLPEISLINLRECDFENGSYVCLVAQVLNGIVKKSFLFDLANLPPNIKIIPISFKVESIGEDADLSDNELQVVLPVIIQNNPHIDSRSVPEGAFLNKSEEILKISQTFLVGNHGPSPLDLNLTILVPQVNVSGIHILEIKTEGTVNGVSSECRFSNGEHLNVKNAVKLQVENDTKVLTCLESLENCVSILCIGGYLPKSNKNAVFTLKLTLHIKPTVKFLDNVTKLILISSAAYSNDTTQFFTTASTYLYTTPNDMSSSIPLWIYLVSIIVGVILLLLLVFTLYKCNFFKRTYKEMIENEKSGENMGELEILQEEEEE